MTEVTSDDVFQAVMHGAMYPAFENWVKSYNMRLVEMPGTDEEIEAGLRIFGVAPTQAFWDNV